VRNVASDVFLLFPRAESRGSSHQADRAEHQRIVDAGAIHDVWAAGPATYDHIVPNHRGVPTARIPCPGLPSMNTVSVQQANTPGRAGRRGQGRYSRRVRLAA
jgi:hypothetical protein